MPSRARASVPRGEGAISYRAPVGEFRFLFDHVVDLAQVTATDRYGEATPEMVEAILTGAARFCDEVLAPLQRAGDLHPARLENGVVRCSPGFVEGYAAIRDGGWGGTWRHGAAGRAGLGGQ